MKNIKSCTNIVDYWNAVERFAPYKLNTKEKSGYVKSIQLEVLCDKSMPWINQKDFSHQQTIDKEGEIEKTWIYNVFVGTIKCDDITKLIKAMLKDSDVDYNTRSDDSISCICTFQLNYFGKISRDTFAIPEYFISMACLNKKNEYPTTWLNFAPIIQKKIEDTYNNWVDTISGRADSRVLFADITELLSNILEVVDLSRLSDYIKNNLAIYSSNVPVPKKFTDAKGKEILAPIKNPDLNIIGSFYLDDIRMVGNAIHNETNTIGKGLKDYLGIIEQDNKYDLRQDKDKLKELSNPAILPSSRWPVSNKVALSIAQQISVNLAVSEKQGVFSVNGPPGTGKSTLLRDIISTIATNRAKVLASFLNPEDAFSNPTTLSIDRYSYKIWTLDPKLLGHEIVIASTNNSAVENISKEIPRLSEVDAEYGLEYFSEIASYINNEECWGLGSAVLGNKTNRSNFFDKFWSKKPSKKENGEIDHNYGLEYLLSIKKPTSNWQEDRERFLSTIKEFEALQSELMELEKAIEQQDSIDKDLSNIDKQLHDLTKKIETHEAKMKSYDDELQNISDAITDYQIQFQQIITSEHKWYVIVLDYLFTKGSLYEKWYNNKLDIENKINILLQEKYNLKIQQNELPVEIEVAKFLQVGYYNEKEKLIDKAKKNDEYISVMQNKYSWSSKIADANFWNSSDQEIQLSSPWIHQELQDIRARIFVESMKLHYSFIINASEQVRNNLNSMRQAVSFDVWPKKFENLLQHVWAVFFLVVPSVSTTFASFSRLFKSFNHPESLGWLLIDEAGQSSPQEALGAIYRAKRTIVVGDPMQIQPVVTISKSINDTLLKYYHVSDKWSVLEESVQTLSDRENTYGTNINGQWIGCPLRVHRRCLDPMFSVANKISYDNLMIQATPRSEDQTYHKSYWLDVQSNHFDGHWSKDEGEEVVKIIQDMIRAHECFPDLYIISPFKKVSVKMQYMLRQQLKLPPILQKQLYTWLQKSVGTIHTFQGKQAEVVILILGAQNPSSIGARDWASGAPNILNVALTRAKYKFVVVGNYNLWASKPNFQILSDAITKCSLVI